MGNVRRRSTVLKTGKSRTRPKTGIRRKKDSAVGMKPAKRHQKPYVSTIIPTIAHPHNTRPTPLKKNMLPCSPGTAGQASLTAEQAYRKGQRFTQTTLILPYEVLCLAVLRAGSAHLQILPPYEESERSLRSYCQSHSTNKHELQARKTASGKQWQ